LTHDAAEIGLPAPVIRLAFPWLMKTSKAVMFFRLLTGTKKFLSLSDYDDVGNELSPACLSILKKQYDRSRIYIPTATGKDIL